MKMTQTLVIDHNPVQKIQTFFCSIIYIKLSIEIAVKIILIKRHGCIDELSKVTSS
jgi:hypothetical protein